MPTPYQTSINNLQNQIRQLQSLNNPEVASEINRLTRQLAELSPELAASIVSQPTNKNTNNNTGNTNTNTSTGGINGGGGVSPSVNPLAANFRSGFSGLPYAGTEGFQELIRKFESDPGKFIQNDQNAATWQATIKGFGDTFSQVFKNYVGRDPSADEYSKFFSSVVNPQWQTIARADPVEFQQRTTNLIRDFYAGEAQKTAEEKAKTQASTALAPNSAFDVWQKATLDNVSQTEKALVDYQSRLFEKLRPQLLTSLQSQGLLNSGALDLAFSGAAKDLADESSNFVASARSAANSDIANRRFAIQQAPNDFALANTFNAVPNLMGAGQQALQNTWQGILQQREFDNQQRLIEAQRQSQPSPLAQYGGLMLGGIASGFGYGAGGRLGRGGGGGMSLEARKNALFDTSMNVGRA